MCHCGREIQTSPDERKQDNVDQSWNCKDTQKRKALVVTHGLDLVVWVDIDLSTSIRSSKFRSSIDPVRWLMLCVVCAETIGEKLAEDAGSDIEVCLTT